MMMQSCAKEPILRTPCTATACRPFISVISSHWRLAVQGAGMQCKSAASTVVPLCSRHMQHAADMHVRHGVAVHAAPRGARPATGKAFTHSKQQPAQENKLVKGQADDQDEDSNSWRASFMTCVLEDAHEGGTFVELRLKGRLGPDMPYRSVNVRPVLLKGKRHLQFAYFTEKQNVVKNEEVGSEAAAERLAQLLLPQASRVDAAAGSSGSSDSSSSSSTTLPFTSATLRTSAADTSVQITKKGGAIVHTHPRAALTSSSMPPASDNLHNSPVLSAATQPPSQSAAHPPAHYQAAAAASLNPALSTASGPISLSLGHDRRKALPIQPNEPHPFLQKIGMQTAEGKLKADMVDKMAQVNDFLKLLAHTGVVERLATAAKPNDRPLRVLDCGCGSSHLTFGTYHYLTHVLGLNSSLEGVDFNAGLMERSNAFSRELGLSPEQARFTAAAIAEYKPAAAPDIILALHACDTATDEALALGVKQGASLIMAVPCCHKHLHKQLAGAKGNAISPMQPLMRQGIVRQRLLDLLTDTLRAQLLRICGYKVDLVEFVSTEHTPRNLLIRAVKVAGSNQARNADGTSHKAQGGAGAQDVAMRAALVQEYEALKAFWGGVTPYLESLLVEQLKA